MNTSQSIPIRQHLLGDLLAIGLVAQLDRTQVVIEAGLLHVAEFLHGHVQDADVLVHQPPLRVISGLVVAGEDALECPQERPDAEEAADMRRLMVLQELEVEGQLGVDEERADVLQRRGIHPLAFPLRVFVLEQRSANPRRALLVHVLDLRAAREGDQRGLIDQVPHGGIQRTAAVALRLWRQVYERVQSVVHNARRWALARHVVSRGCAGNFKWDAKPP